MINPFYWKLFDMLVTYYILNQTSIAHQIKKSSMKIELAYYDYIFSNLYITHDSYGPRINCERSFFALHEDAFIYGRTRVYALV